MVTKHLYGWNDTLTLTATEATKDGYNHQGSLYSLSNYIKIGTTTSKDGDISEYASVEYVTDSNNVKSAKITTLHKAGVLGVWGLVPTLNLYVKIGEIKCHHLVGIDVFKYAKDTTTPTFATAHDITSSVVDNSKLEYNSYSNYSFAYSKSVIAVGGNSKYKFYATPKFEPALTGTEEGINIVSRVTCASYYTNTTYQNVDVNNDGIKDVAIDLSSKNTGIGTANFDIDMFFNCNTNNFSGRTRGDMTRYTFKVKAFTTEQINDWEEEEEPTTEDYITLSSTSAELSLGAQKIVDVKSSGTVRLSYNTTNLRVVLTPKATSGEYTMTITALKKGDNVITLTCGEATEKFNVTAIANRIVSFTITSPTLTGDKEGYVKIENILTENGFIFPDDEGFDLNDYDFSFSDETFPVTNYEAVVVQNEDEEYELRLKFVANIVGGHTYPITVIENVGSAYSTTELIYVNSDYILSEDNIVLKVGESKEIFVYTTNEIGLEDIGEDAREHATFTITELENTYGIPYYKIKIVGTSSTDDEEISFLYELATIKVIASKCTGLTLNMGCDDKIYMGSDYDPTKTYYATAVCDFDGEQFSSNYVVTGGGVLSIIGHELSFDKKTIGITYQLTGVGTGNLTVSDGDGEDEGAVDVVADYITYVTKEIYDYSGVKVKLDGEYVKSDVAYNTDIEWKDLTKIGSPKIHIPDDGSVEVNFGKSSLDVYYLVKIKMKSGNIIEIDGGKQSLGFAKISSKGTGFEVEQPSMECASADNYTSEQYSGSQLGSFKTFTFSDLTTGANSIIVDIDLVDTNNQKSTVAKTDFSVDIPYKYENGDAFGTQAADKVEFDSSIITKASFLISTGESLPTWIRVSDITTYTLPQGWAWSTTPTNPSNGLPQVFTLEAKMTANEAIKKVVYVFYIPAVQKYTVVLNNGWDGSYSEDPLILVLDTDINKFYLLGMPSSVKNGSKTYGDVVTVSSSTLSGYITLILKRN